MYVGLEDGRFFGYLTEPEPLGLVYGQSPFLGFNKTLYMWKYSIDKDGGGLPIAYVKNTSYNVRKRPWYVTAKSLKRKYWTDPYIDAASGNPVVSLIYPILNYTLHGQYMAYAGSVAADVYLTQISAYLENEYYNTDMIVFIVDQRTLSLLGNSLGAMTYAQGPGDTKVSCRS